MRSCAPSDTKSGKRISTCGINDTHCSVLVGSVWPYLAYSLVSLSLCGCFKWRVSYKKLVAEYPQPPQVHLVWGVASDEVHTQKKSAPHLFIMLLILYHLRREVVQSATYCSPPV